MSLDLGTVLLSYPDGRKVKHLVVAFQQAAKKVIDQPLVDRWFTYQEEKSHYEADPSRTVITLSTSHLDVVVSGIYAKTFQKQDSITVPLPFEEVDRLLADSQRSGQTVDWTGLRCDWN